jgi:hypothetical protein
VLLVGGKASTIALKTAELFNPADGSFTATAGTPQQARLLHSATFLNSGKVLLAGGMSGATGSAELYDPSSDSFSTTGDLRTARSLQSTATPLFTGSILLAGGTGGTTGSAELFTPE